MKTRFLVAAVCLLLVGCKKHPEELERSEKLDAECGGHGLAFVYPIATGGPIMERAVKVGCYAPVGAWTDESEASKGGARKMVLDLRENEKKTLLCCNN